MSRLFFTAAATVDCYESSRRMNGSIRLQYFLGKWHTWARGTKLMSNSNAISLSFQFLPASGKNTILPSKNALTVVLVQQTKPFNWSFSLN